MESFHEYMNEYKKQMEKGVITQAYKGLMEYIQNLKTYFKNKYPDYLISGSIYFGYMDMTYFSFYPKSLGQRKLKIAIVFIHNSMRFEAWLAGYNKQIQSKYWEIFKESNWNKYRLVSTTQGADSILEHILADNPDFSDLVELTTQIERETMKFIRDIESFFSKEAIITPMANFLQQEIVKLFLKILVFRRRKRLIMDLSQVSRTAILLLICRAVLSEKDKSGFNDPMAVLGLERLISIASEEDKRWIIRRKRMYEGIQTRDAKAGTRRGKVFDAIANRFIDDNPGCTVINLACGFDTRFWRIENEKCKYIELDLPEVINLKKKIFKDHLGYEVIGGSVLDISWIDTVTKNGNTKFLLIAEGLFMWLPQQEAIRVFKEIGKRFQRSQLVLDMVPENFTKGIWKELIRLHSKIDFGLDVSWDFGIKDPQDMEAYGNGFKVIGVEKGSAGPVILISINAVAG